MKNSMTGLASLLNFSRLRSAVTLLPKKDRVALEFLAGFIFCVGFYFLLWQPAVSFRERAEDRYLKNRELMGWMLQNEARARELSGRENVFATPATQDSVLAIIDKAARERGIQLQRYEPGADASVRVWIEGAEFNSLISWLSQLLLVNNIQPAQLSIESSKENGAVDARIELR